MIALCSVIAARLKDVPGIVSSRRCRNGHKIKALSGEGACEHNFDLEGRVEDFGSAALALCGGVCA